MSNIDDDEVAVAMKMSLETSPPAPEAKRSKPLDESPDSRNRRLQRELMASAAEKRMKAVAASREERMKSCSSASKSKAREEPAEEPKVASESVGGSRELGGLGCGEALSESVYADLFDMVFGSGVSMDVLGQWSSQGIRFSSDPETCMGLVQHEGGPCGVLATIQAYVLKYLLFLPDDLGRGGIGDQLYNFGGESSSQRLYSASKYFAYITEERKIRALVHSMVEILFLCGTGRRAVVATIEIPNKNEHQSDDVQIEKIMKHLEGISIKSASDLQRIVKINTFDSQAIAFAHLLKAIPIFQSGLGATLFLISALLSRGLESVQADRDDPSQPLVTAPFGHASQEIVNLLICGQAVPNVFDGRMDLGGGMFVKGIPSSVEVGFLTLLESLNFCKVGQHLKRPKWPIWVVGSESHYTVLFALDPSVQKENELEERESNIRKTFDAQDQSGGGGFISVEGFHLVLRETNINFPSEKLDSLCNAGYIVWSEFWQALLDLDKSLGGFKDSSGSLGKKQFDIYHFNGIAKSVLNGAASSSSDSPMQRPRLCKLAVSVPPRWSPDEFLADVTSTASTNPSNIEAGTEVNQPQPSQHAPLVDCIRTRWPRAVCSWTGDAPSIV